MKFEKREFEITYKIDCKDFEDGALILNDVNYDRKTICYKIGICKNFQISCHKIEREVNAPEM